MVVGPYIHTIMKTKMLLMSLAFSLVFSSLGVYAQDGSVSEVTVNGAKVMVCSLDKVKKTETIPLSRLVENCTLIRFETNQEAFFKAWFITVTDKYIGVRQQGNGSYKLFDRSGKFLCNVGAVGKGPGEYSMSLYDDIIDDQSNLIYLSPFMGNKLLLYSTSGKFIKYIEVPEKLNKPKIFLSNGILTVVHMPFQDAKAIAYQLDAKGSVLKQLSPPAFMMASSYDGEIFNTRNTPAFDFMYTGSDTLYHFNGSRNKIEPIFTMSVSPSQKAFRQYFELKHHYFTYISGKGLISTDKDKKTSSFITIVNDYFGNLPMRASITNFRNGWYVYTLEPADLQELINKRLEDKTCTEQDKQVLKKLLPTLKEADNNVMFIGKLK